MLGLKLVLLGIAFVVASGIMGGAYTVVSLLLGLTLAIVGVFVKDKKS